jgi:hypothetical protein
VFGPLIFLIFINDITNNTSSTARLFADECVLYRTINCEADAITLQKDQGTMEQWEAKWLKEFNLFVISLMKIRKISGPNTFPLILMSVSLQVLLLVSDLLGNP